MRTKNSGMWAYLDASGVLENGSDEQIKEAKRNYRKQYFVEFKRKQRAIKSEFTVSLSNSNGEYGKIAFASKKHNISITAFIKQATLAYINQSFVVPDKMQIAKLELLLSDCLNEIKLIIKGKERFFWEREGKFEKIENRIIELQQNINNVLRNPPLLHSNDSKNQIP